MGCSWAKMYLLMGHGGSIHIGKNIWFICIFFWILHGYVSNVCIGIGYVSRYPMRYGLKCSCFRGEQT
jgi:hypothetical protein